VEPESGFATENAVYGTSVGGAPGTWGRASLFLCVEGSLPYRINMIMTSPRSKPVEVNCIPSPRYRVNVVNLIDEITKAELTDPRIKKNDRFPCTKTNKNAKNSDQHFTLL
jgi:hypothetical protein